MIKIYVLEKNHTQTGNPNYKLFIPGQFGTIKGLRKLKTPSHYSTVSYNLGDDLKNYVFKGIPIEVYDIYGDRIKLWR